MIAHDDNIPERSGFYWWRWSETREWLPVEWDAEMRVLCIPGEFPIDLHPKLATYGQWSCTELKQP